MKKNKFFGLILMVIGVLSIIGGVVIMYDNNSDNIEEKEDEITHKEEIENVIKNDFLSNSTNISKITNLTGDINTNYVVLGTDSFLRSVPDTDEDLSLYKEIQNEYASIVEEKYLAGTTYSVDEDLNITIKPWYFSLYSSDLSRLVDRLLELENVDEDLIETNNSLYKIYEYKARVKAMIILNDYLDNYNNKDEELNFVFYYGEDNQYFSLYYNLVGVSSEYMVQTSEQSDEQLTRVNSCLEEAITSGIIDENDPLKIDS